MEATAKLMGARISPQKARLVVDQIRGLPVEQAEQILAFSNKKAAHMVRKVLMSALANAEHNSGADIDELNVRTAFVDEWPTFKRSRPRAKCSSTSIFRRTNQITLVVAEDLTLWVTRYIQPGFAWALPRTGGPSGMQSRPILPTS